MRNPAPLLLTSFVLLASANAQDDPLEPDMIQPASDELRLTWGELVRFLPVPLGIPRGALAPEGHFGVGVRVQQTQWDGMRDGRDDISNAQQQAQFGFTTFAEEMTETSVEVDMQYGLQDGWRLFATLPFLDRELDWTNAGGGSGTASNTGLGDVVLGAAYTPVIRDDRIVDLQLGLSLPTGDFDARDDYAGATDTVLPYAMQLGTGTVDLHPSVSLMKRERSFVWGARLGGRFHTDKNSDGWARSDEMRLDLWGSVPLADRFVGTARLRGDWWGDLHGNSDDLDETRSALEDPHRQRGSLVQVVLGVAWDIKDPATHRNRLEIEIGIPVDEWLDGPGLSRDTSLLIGWRALL